MTAFSLIRGPTAFDHEILMQGKEIRYDGRQHESRAGTTRRIHNAVTRCRVDQAFHKLKARRDNLLHKYIETLWVMCGLEVVYCLYPFMPRALDFCDQPGIWRGAYGPRIFKECGAGHKIDQVVRMLNEDPTTRRAVVNIYNHDRDLGVDSKDIPCNIAIAFHTEEVNGIFRLNATVFIRSNDLIWGLSGINMFEWAGVVSYVCGRTELIPGEVIVHSVDLHIYEDRPDVIGRMDESIFDLNGCYEGYEFNPMQFFYYMGEQELWHGRELPDSDTDPNGLCHFEYVSQFLSNMNLRLGYLLFNFRDKNQDVTLTNTYEYCSEKVRFWLHCLSCWKGSGRTEQESKAAFMPLVWISYGYCYFLHHLANLGSDVFPDAAELYKKTSYQMSQKEDSFLVPDWMEFSLKLVKKAAEKIVDKLRGGTNE